MASGVALKSRILGGLWGHAVGDALGVPVEFCSRQERERDPVADLRGFGTHNQPPGTWSDDTSLTLCTIDTLLHSGEDYGALGRSFVRWLNAEVWTAHGSVFDVGIATASAIRRLARGVAPLEAGRYDKDSNGNGSLMRMLPVAIWFAGRPAADTIEAAHRYSALTHRHPRSQVGCAIYCLTVQRLMTGGVPNAAVDMAWRDVNAHYDTASFASELSVYSRLVPVKMFEKLHAQAIRGSGYVVHALEASIWCLLNSRSFEEAVLKAINLGEDTDTTGSITGALAGVHYGVEAIPAVWRAALARSDDLDKLFNAFADRAASAA